MNEEQPLPEAWEEPLPEPEVQPRPRRWWVVGIVLVVAGALLATFVPGLLPREGTSSGTGFVVAEGGYVLTAAHVVLGATEITVYQDGRGYAASIAALSTDHDLALLSAADAPPMPVAALAKGRPEFGDTVITVGHPAGSARPTTRSTSVVGVGWWAVGPEGAVLRDLIATQDPFRRGYSGAPLVNEAGQVVGIVTGSVNAPGGGELGFAVSIHRTVDWLAGWGMTLPLGSGTPSVPSREGEVVDLISASVVRVEARLPPGARR